MFTVSSTVVFKSRISWKCIFLLNFVWLTLYRFNSWWSISCPWFSRHHCEHVCYCQLTSANSTEVWKSLIRGGGSDGWFPWKWVILWDEMTADLGVQTLVGDFWLWKLAGVLQAKVPYKIFFPCTFSVPRMIYCFLMSTLIVLFDVSPQNPVHLGFHDMSSTITWFTS